MKNLSLEFLRTFGFSSLDDLLSSSFHKSLLTITLPLAGIVAVLEQYLGLKTMTLIAFLLTVMLELITGLTASVVEGRVITSRKFSRFGLKCFIWFCFLFILHMFKLEYKESNYILFQFFDWAHSTLLVYVTMEYIISIDENVTRITGKKGSAIGIIRKKLSELIKPSNPKDKNGKQ